ncbi:MAG: sulfatase [Prolixibacteraceae bacterium]
MNVIKLSGLFSLGALSVSVNLYSQDQTPRPNIIFILADDLGYTDVNCFATRITGTPAKKQFYETPNIDKLASQGVAFSQAYACPLCSPTRSSIITGKYASRLGFMTATAGTANTFYVQGIKPPDGFHEQGCYWSDKIANPIALLNGNTLIALPSGQPQDNGRDEITLAEALKGYHSAFLGKWHLGGHGSEGYQPHDQGFEELAYFDAGGSLYFDWRKNWNRKEKYFPKMRQKELVQGKAGEDKGINYLTCDLTQRALDYIDQHAQNADGKPFFLYFCEFAVHAPNQAPDSAIHYFSQKATKGWKGQNSAVYAAMISYLDISVGKIMDKLKETGIDNNTIVIFMSDNGGITVGKGGEEVPVTTNSPLTGQKASVYEGGIRVPLIISHKGKIKGGKWCENPVDCNDLFPTLLELAGEPKPTHQIDGQSFVGLLNDPKNRQKTYTRDTYFWHYPLSVIYKNPADNLPFTPHSAVRKGDYKLIFDWYGRLNLYNIRKDISEKNNLAKQMPEKTRELFAELMNYLEKNVEKKYWPTVNPDYNPETEVRKIPFVDLYKAYKEGNDIVELAH